MESITLRIGFTRNSQPQEERKTQHPAFSGQLIPLWCDLEIRSFLQVWEFLHCEVYHGMRKKDYMLAGAIAQRLQCKGVKKSWQQCHQMLRDLKDLYWTVHEANERPRREPLGCPYRDALHRILGPRWEKKFSGQLIPLWCDLEIRSFLQVWEFLHCEVYHGMRKKDYMLAGAIAQRLQCKGVKKSWQQCHQMLRDLKDLYWTVHEANERPRRELLGCPYRDALHRILGPRWEKKFSGPPCAAAAGFLSHHPSQPFTFTLEGPPPVFHMEDPQVPKCEIWPMNLLCPISCLLPASLLGDPSPQQEWSTISNSDTYLEYRLS